MSRALALEQGPAEGRLRLRPRLSHSVIFPLSRIFFKIFLGIKLSKRFQIGSQHPTPNLMYIRVRPVRAYSLLLTEHNTYDSILLYLLSIFLAQCVLIHDTSKYNVCYLVYIMTHTEKMYCYMVDIESLRCVTCKFICVWQLPGSQIHSAMSSNVSSKI